MSIEEIRGKVEKEFNDGEVIVTVGNYVLAIGELDVWVTHISGEKMNFEIHDVETRKHQHAARVIKWKRFDNRDGFYWKQHATWRTKNGDLEYMFGDGTIQEYDKNELSEDAKTKIEMILTFIYDQSTFEQFDRFSNKGAQEFMNEFGYGSCDNDNSTNIFDIKESFENTDRCITIPVSDDEEAVSIWVSNGIGEGDLDRLKQGLLPEGYN